MPEIELLGQNEILEIEKSESARFALVEKFLPDPYEFSEHIEEIKQKLAANRKSIVEAQENFDVLDSKINEEGKLQEQKETYKKLGVEEKLKNSALLGKELQIQERADEQFDQIEEWLEQYEDVVDLTFLQHENIQNSPNTALISKVASELETLKKFLDDLVNQAEGKLTETKSEYERIKIEWTENSNNIRDQINEAINQLPDQQGKSGKEVAAAYEKIVRELTHIEGYKERHKQQKRSISELEKNRSLLLKEYRDTAFERYGAMNKAVEKLNGDELRGKVKVNVSRCKNLEDLKDFLKDLAGIGEKRIQWLDKIEEPIDLLAWAQWIKEKSKSKFIEKYATLGLADSTIDRLTALSLDQRLKLEEIELKDVLSIELNIAHESSPDPRYVLLEDLSLGQKCTAILNLLLIKRDDPLIIDQPEDNLDNAFIAERIVSELRELKPNRQFLFATHNANIPVFGDAELIAVLENEASKATFAGVGTIDSPAIRDHAAQILEGGKAAFDMRKEKYGF